MIFVELEKLLKKDGWYYYIESEFHVLYKHKKKQGVFTIPKHRGNVKSEIINVIVKQAKM